MPITSIGGLQQTQGWQTQGIGSQKHQHARSPASTPIQNMVLNPTAQATPIGQATPGAILPPASQTLEKVQGTVIGGKKDNSLIDFKIPGTNLDITI